VAGKKAVAKKKAAGAKSKGKRPGIAGKGNSGPLPPLTSQEKAYLANNPGPAEPSPVALLKAPLPKVAPVAADEAYNKEPVSKSEAKRVATMKKADIARAQTAVAPVAEIQAAFGTGQDPALAIGGGTGPTKVKTSPDSAVSFLFEGPIRTTAETILTALAAFQERVKRETASAITKAPAWSDYVTDLGADFQDLFLRARSLSAVGSVVEKESDPLKDRLTMAMEMADLVDRVDEDGNEIPSAGVAVAFYRLKHQIGEKTTTDNEKVKLHLLENGVDADLIAAAFAAGQTTKKYAYVMPYDCSETAVAKNQARGKKGKGKTGDGDGDGGE